MSKSARCLIAFLALLLLAPATAATQPTNPFTGGPPSEAAVDEDAPQRRPSGGSAISLRLSQLQGELQQRMSAFIRALHGERSSVIWASLLGLGALYGVIHTLLPGHRKTVLFSYFMSENARPIHGIVAGVSLAILHAGAAIAIVLGSYWLIESSLNVAVNRANEIVQDLSAWLIIALGSLFLVAKVRHALSHRHGAHHDPEAQAHHGEEAHRDKQEHHDPGNSRPATDYARPAAANSGSGGDSVATLIPADTTERGGAPLSLPAIVLSGLVPCPGSTVVLLFSLSLGIVTVGIATVSAISFGMAVTLSAISVATITLKRTILAREGRFAHLLHHGIEIGAAAVMLLFGIALVLA